MISTLLWMGWTSLKRDRVSLLLTFALPIAFFSIFVGIFGSSAEVGSGQTRVIVVDEDRSEVSGRFVQALRRETASLDVRTDSGGVPAIPYDRAAAVQLVKSGKAPVAIVLPKGFGATFASFDGNAVAADLVQDTTRDPVAPQMLIGIMQKAAMTGAPDLMIQRGLDQFDKYAGGLTPTQRLLMDTWLPRLREQTTQPDAANDDQDDDASPSTQSDQARGSKVSGFAGLVSVNPINVQDQEHKTSREAFISFQVAQTAVMFLLFSMAGAAGTLLEEQESGTLDRVLGSNLGMNGLLLGKWLFTALVGMAQLAVMFLWAWRPFGLSLFTPLHLAGFSIMTVVTALAGAAFGMVLATACRSRGQLSGVSTIIILIMSAVGGSMFPRFLMSENMQRYGLATFNAWALDGYRKVFYDNLPLWELWPQVSVLLGLTAGFLILARLFARRWERS